MVSVFSLKLRALYPQEALHSEAFRRMSTQVTNLPQTNMEAHRDPIQKDSNS